MELKRIPISSIQANPNNPRKDFGDIKAFAETFKLNPQYPGEPYTPLIVVPDGSYFTISDGERRLRAMKELGTEECGVIVCEDFEQADSLAAMLATDDKKALTEVERSVGVQQMLVLGVDPKIVETAAGLKKGQAKKVRKAMEAAGDASTQATIDQLLKGLEIKEIGGDDSDVASVIEADPDEWEATYKGLKAEIEAEKALRDFAGYLESEGLELSEAASEGTAYKRLFRRPDDLLEWLESHPDREGVEFVYDERNRTVDMYSERKAEADADGEDGQAAEEGDEDVEQPSKLADLALKFLNEGGDSRTEWYLKACKRGSVAKKRIRTTPHVDKWIESRAPYLAVLDGALDRHGIRADELAQGGGMSSGVAAAFAYLYAKPYINPYDVRYAVRGDIEDRTREWMEGWVECVEAFMFEGWRMADGEADFYRMACDELGRRPYDDGGEIGEGSEAQPSAPWGSEFSEEATGAADGAWEEDDDADIAATVEEAAISSHSVTLQIEGDDPAAMEEAPVSSGAGPEGADRAMDARKLVFS